MADPPPPDARTGVVRESNVGARQTGTVVLLNFNADERDSYRDALVAAGFDVVVSFDPFDALRVVRSRRPDALVTRVIQPHWPIDGIELIRQVRADARTADTYVVVTMSLREAARRQDAVDAGSDECLVLPDSPDEIVRAVIRGIAASTSGCADRLPPSCGVNGG